MSDPQGKPEAKTENATPGNEPLPRAKIKRRRFKIPFVWIVPVVSAIVAAYLIHQRVNEFGPELTIHFKDVTGIRPGQTPIRYRGVNVGRVTDIELSRDGQSAIVKGRLKRSVTSLARNASLFWIVRPELGIANVTGLGTIITGPHIELLPAGETPRLEFIGMDDTPATREHDGLNLVLLSLHRGSLKRGSPIYYRGIEVGGVRDCQLGDEADTVRVLVFIQQQYTNLVRGDSKFWNVSGIDMKFGLFRGAEINMESLKSLVSGGISFATPTELKEGPVKDGAVFRLHDEARAEWLEWSPKIPLEKK
jgi:paraquat-inducible protein B